jgi:Bacterial low temperature requirement A protein (LtrA)
MTNVTVELRGWSAEPIFIGTACVGLAFGCWWLYFLKPFGDFLKNRRERASRWGYSHLLIFSSIVAMGAGLQTCGKYLEGKSKFSPGAIVAFTAISVGVYISSVLLTNFDSFLKPETNIRFSWWRLHDLGCVIHYGENEFFYPSVPRSDCDRAICRGYRIPNHEVRSKQRNLISPRLLSRSSGFCSGQLFAEFPKTISCLWVDSVGHDSFVILQVIYGDVIWVL